MISRLISAWRRETAKLNATVRRISGAEPETLLLRQRQTRVEYKLIVPNFALYDRMTSYKTNDRNINKYQLFSQVR